MAGRGMAQRCGLREARIHFGMFNFHFWAVIGPQAKLAEYVAWRHEKPLDKVPRFSTYGFGGCIYRHGTFAPIIWLPRYPRTAREHATLAHEVLHVVGELGRWAGMPFEFDSEEAYCHALGYGVARILEEFK